MPAVAQFPTPTDFQGLGGPYWVTFLYNGPTFGGVTVGPAYEDGSHDRNVSSAAGTHTWTIEYDTRDEDLAILDQHYQAAVGPAYGFNFYDHRLGAVFTNVHYQKYERAAGKRAGRSKRRVTLVCEPT